MLQLRETYSELLLKLGLAMPGRRLWILFGAGILLVSAVMLWGLLGRRTSEPDLAIDPEVAALDLQAVRKQLPIVEGRLRKLMEKRNRLFTASPAILVDSAGNQIYLLRGPQLLLKDKCSTGTGFELTDTAGKRTWTFDTPRGYFHVLGKVTHPVWYRPDWAFIEEGTPIPKDRSSRAVPDVLGDYALAFGDGYFIHGTLYTRMLGNSVTHGCIRVDDDTLKKLYSAAQTGTSIWIF